MITTRAARWSKLALLTAGILALGGATVTPSHAVSETQIVFVQGLPDRVLDVAIDGEPKAEDLATAATAGPFTVKPGSRIVTFSENGRTILENTFSIEESSKADIVAHLPASSSGAPLITVYKYADAEVADGKALLVVSHTAAAPPIEFRLNDQPVFDNIANKEFTQQPVPAATYQMSLGPTGQQNQNFYGPVGLTVNRGQMNRVYVVGDAEKRTMRVVKHDVAAKETGSEKPSEVNTGTGCQAVGDAP